jgi:hypothetical protein
MKFVLVFVRHATCWNQRLAKTLTSVFPSLKSMNEEKRRNTNLVIIHLTQNKLTIVHAVRIYRNSSHVILKCWRDVHELNIRHRFQS